MKADDKARIYENVQIKWLQVVFRICIRLHDGEANEIVRLVQLKFFSCGVRLNIFSRQWMNMENLPHVKNKTLECCMTCLRT